MNHVVDIFEYPSTGGPVETRWAASCLLLSCRWSRSGFADEKSARRAGSAHGPLSTPAREAVPA